MLTTDSKHAYPVAPNLLNRKFEAVAPNEKWVADITYIPTREGWLYLAAVLDLYSRKIVGWGMSHQITADLAEDALRMRHSMSASLTLGCSITPIRSACWPTRRLIKHPRARSRNSWPPSREDHCIFEPRLPAALAHAFLPTDQFYDNP